MQDNNIDLFNLQSYQFNLPVGFIAQYPAEPRDSSGLLVLDKKDGRIEDRVFTDLIDYMEAGDTLVLNRTRVIPARLFGYKPTGGKVEILLLRKIGDKWETLVQPAKRLKTGSIINFSGSDTRAEIIQELDMRGGRLIRFQDCTDEDSFINNTGHIPLPPYINRNDENLDKDRYQTIYANANGSSAAPTAGLHFTDRLIKRIHDKGINTATLVLHVGLGTFRPVYSQDIRKHDMHYEYYQIDADTADLLNRTRDSGNNIIAVGTTVVRTLETMYDEKHGFSAGEGETNKFIYPGYDIKSIDSLITNFHLPGSSLLMLVAAFAGFTYTMAAYKHAVENRYRFFSYGDAMYIK